MPTRSVIQTEKTLPGTHNEAEVECPNDSAELIGVSIRHWSTLEKESWIDGSQPQCARYTTITAHWVIKDWAD